MAMAGSGIMNSGQANGTKYYQNDQKASNQMANGYREVASKGIDGYASMNNKRGTDFKKNAQQMLNK